MRLEGVRRGALAELGVARFQLGRALGGDEGSELVRSARELYVEIGAGEVLLEALG